MVPFGPSPPNPLTCPRCEQPGTAAPVPQPCTRCGRRFALMAGPALDAAVVPPPPNPSAYPLKLKWSIVVTYRFATLDPQGITSGTLDPVIGVAPLDQVAIAFPDVVSIATWRNIAWPETIFGVLFPLPIAVLCAWGAVAAMLKDTGVGVTLGLIALAFGALTAWLIRRGVVVGRRYARVVGRWQSLTVQLDRSPLFYAELFRRCGLMPPPAP